MVNICASDRPGSDISSRPCAIALPSLLQWFCQLVTVPDHNCNWCTLQCIVLKVTSCAIEWRVVLIFASVCTCVYCTEQLNAANLIYPMKSIAKKLKQKLGFCWFVCPNFHFGPLLTFTFHFFLTFVSLQLAAEWAGRTYLTSNGCAGRLEGWDPVFTLGVLRTWWGQSCCLHSTFTFSPFKGSNSWRSAPASWS